MIFQEEAEPLECGSNNLKALKVAPSSAIATNMETLWIGDIRLKCFQPM